jgi:hypothetical protein
MKYLQRTSEKTQMKHLEHTPETYVYSHYNMCNIMICFCNIKIKHLQYPDEKHQKHLKHKVATCTAQMSSCCLDEVLEQRGHAGEGECRNGQELPHAEVEVPAREVCVDERPKEVVVVIPRATETSDSSTMPASMRFWRSGRDMVVDAAHSGIGAPRGVQR